MTSPSERRGMPVLSIGGLDARYGRVRALRDISLEVPAGDIVVVLGANGAGKTSLLRAVSGMVQRRGSIKVDGRETVGRSMEAIARLGVSHVPQGRGTFAQFTVDENLRLGAWTRRGPDVRADIDTWYEYFPRLGERRDQRAGSLSGGEQQMLALARALMAHPRILLLDEPSLGLAPVITADLFHRLRAINRDYGTTMLVVEQNAVLAFEIADGAYLLEAGQIVAQGPVEDLAGDEALRKAYLGY